MRTKFTLTTTIRRQIAAAVLEHRFKDEYDAIANRVADAAERVRAAFVGPKNLALLDSLPDGWIESKLGIRVIMPHGTLYYIHFSGDFQSYIPTRSYDKPEGCIPASFGRNDVRRRVPENYRSVGQPVTDKELNSDLTTLSKDIDAFVERFVDARKYLAATLQGTSSSLKLIATWPEIAPFVDAIGATLGKSEAVVASVPAIRYAQLNAMLGLPVE